jgi:cytochrome c peroxidase
VCHTVGEKYALFTDNKFHNIGVGVNDERVSDVGRFKETERPEDMGSFKTPSLRNVAITAPYFHDGSRQTLKQAMDYYVGGGNSNPNLDQEMHPLNFLTAQERADLIAFLESLTGEIPANSGPPSK